MPCARPIAAGSSPGVAAPDLPLPRSAEGQSPIPPPPRSHLAFLWLAHHVAPPGIGIRLLRLWLRLGLWWRGLPTPRELLAVGTLCDGSEETAVHLAFLVALLQVDPLSPLLHVLGAQHEWAADATRTLPSDLGLRIWRCANSGPRIDHQAPPFPRRQDGFPWRNTDGIVPWRDRVKQGITGQADMMPMCGHAPTTPPRTTGERGGTK